MNGEYEVKGSRRGRVFSSINAHFADDRKTGF